MQRFPVAVALLLGAATGASAADSRYPAAQCAAYWLGRDDAARHSAFLDADADDRARADAYAAVAVRSNGGDAGAIKDFIRRERPDMARLVRAAILGDPTSVAVQERLLQTCADYAATQPETRDLP